MFSNKYQTSILWNAQELTEWYPLLLGHCYISLQSGIHHYTWLVSVDHPKEVKTLLDHPMAIPKLQKRDPILQAHTYIDKGHPIPSPSPRMHTYIYISIHACRVFAGIHTYIQIYIVYTCLHTRTHISIHTHTHTHVHMMYMYI